MVNMYDMVDEYDTVACLDLLDKIICKTQVIGPCHPVSYPPWLPYPVGSEAPIYDRVGIILSRTLVGAVLATRGDWLSVL